MNLVADESVDFTIVRLLRRIGFTVYSISESSPSISDEEVLQIAFQKNSILITEDKDFGELVIRFKKKNKGIVLIRLIGVGLEKKIEIIEQVFREHFEEMKNKFVVISKNYIRIRNTK